MLVELIDRTGLGAGQLGRLCNDGGQTVSRSSVELTAWLTSPSARSSSTERPSSVVLIAQLVEQTNVLNGDDGLVGECGDQLDLLVAERPHRVTLQNNDADGHAFAHQRNRQHGSHADRLWLRPSIHILHLPIRQQHEWLRPSTMARPAIEPRPRGRGCSFHVRLELWRKPVDRNEVNTIASCTTNCCLIRLTQFGCRLDQRVEHCLKIEGRAADDLEHVGGRGLLLQRFA